MTTLYGTPSWEPQVIPHAPVFSSETAYIAVSFYQGGEFLGNTIYIHAPGYNPPCPLLLCAFTLRSGSLELFLDLLSSDNSLCVKLEVMHLCWFPDHIEKCSPPCSARER